LVITGFELSLDVSVRWWEKVCADGGVKIPPLSVQPDGLHVDTTLVLAILPFSEVLAYYDPYGIRRYGSAAAYETVKNGELEQNGWRRNDFKNELDGSIDPRVEHRFFTVSHWSV